MSLIKSLIPSGSQVFDFHFRFKFPFLDICYQIEATDAFCLLKQKLYFFFFFFGLRLLCSWDKWSWKAKGALLHDRVCSSFSNCGPHPNIGSRFRMKFINSYFNQVLKMSSWYLNDMLATVSQIRFFFVIFSLAPSLFSFILVQLNSQNDSTRTICIREMVKSLGRSLLCLLDGGICSSTGR